MLRQLGRPISNARTVAVRGLHRHPLAPASHFFPNDVWHRMSRMSHEFDRIINNAFKASPFRPFVENPESAMHPSIVEDFRVRNPIIEEDGVKKFKLSFDVRRFKPEDVKIETTAADKMLKIEAKHFDEMSNYQYARTVSLPEGVNPSEIKCTYRSDGVLLVEAPYVEPPPKEPVVDTPIAVSHK
uniref:SHSP domain-containing protein n=1 Tax=Panagrellus redivivus TaxID=6233 RepID=A0A7E4VSG1_PANRE